MNPNFRCCGRAGSAVPVFDIAAARRRPRRCAASDSINDHRALCELLRRLRLPALVGVEGFSGAGKSKLSNDLGADLDAVVIQLDDYILPGDESLPYHCRIDLVRMALAIAHARSTTTLMIIEGICLRQILERLGLCAELFIYVKRVARNGLWHDGFHLADFESGVGLEENYEEPHRSDFSYHAVSRPHEKADLLFDRIEAEE